jgi:hypothetical protein
MCRSFEIRSYIIKISNIQTSTFERKGKIIEVKKIPLSEEAYTKNEKIKVQRLNVKIGKKIYSKGVQNYKIRCRR